MKPQLPFLPLLKITVVLATLLFPAANYAAPSAASIAIKVGLTSGDNTQITRYSVTNAAGALNTVNWNNMLNHAQALTGPSNLVYDLNGTATASSATVTWLSKTTSARDIGLSSAQANQNSRLVGSFLRCDNGNTGGFTAVTVTNLDAAFTNGFSVYVYYMYNQDAAGGQYLVTNNLKSVTWNGVVTSTARANAANTAINPLVQDVTQNNTLTTATETAGANYIVYTGYTGNWVSLVVSNRANGEGVPVCGIEIVAALTGTTTTIARHSDNSGTSSTYGDALKFNVTVTGSSPTGTVTVKDGGAGGTTLGTGTLSGGAATITITNLTAFTPSSHANIVAVYAGDSNNAGSTSTPLSSQTVSQKALTVTGITANNKTYNGETTTTLSGTGTLNGIVGNDSVSLTGTAAGSFGNANVGTGKTVTVSGLSLTGGQASNYTLTPPSPTANITAATVTIVSGITADNKNFNGNTTATISSNNVVLSGVIEADAANVSLSTNGYTANFSNANVGTGKPVTVSGLTLTGSATGNYTLTQPSLSADITAANPVVTIISGLTAGNKTYDGTTSATISSNDVVLDGVAPEDVGNVSLSTDGYTATFASATVGTGIEVAVSGLTLVGSAAGNYTLTQPTLSADITQAEVNVVSGITANHKPLDNNDTVTISSNNVVLSGVIEADAANVSLSTNGYTANFDDANTGTGKPVTVSGLTLTGSASGNYTLTQPADLTANIQVLVTVSSGLTANSKTYDGTTTATISSNDVVLDGVALEDADNVSLSTNGYTATFETATAGTGKSVTVSNLTLTGSAAAAYAVVQPTLTADINPATATVASGLSANNKPYDGTTTATISSNNVVLSGVLAGDVANVSLSTNGYTAAFDMAAAGMGKSVTVSGLTLTGSAAENYTLAQPTLSANITKATVTISSGITANNKPYDGATTATISSNNVVLSGVIAGDVANVSVSTNGYTATFANSVVGTGIGVTVSGLSLTGSAANNYNLTPPTGLIANITRPANIKSIAIKVGLTSGDNTQITRYSVTSAAGVLQTVNWNNMIGQAQTIAGPSNLVYDLNGTPTASSAKVSWLSQTSNARDIGLADQTNQNSRLVGSFLRCDANGSGAMTAVTVTNLDAAFTNGFTVYVYYMFNQDAVGGQYIVSDGSTSIVWNGVVTTTARNNAANTAINPLVRDVTQNNALTTAAETPGANYIVFTGLKGTNVSLVVSNRANGEGIPVSGIEIVADPVRDTTTELTSSLNPSGYRDSVTFTADIQTNSVLASAATGTVQFKTNGVAFGSPVSLTSGSAALTTTNLVRGTYAVAAEYSGDGNYGASTNSLSQSVTNHPPAATAVTVSRAPGLAGKISKATLLAHASDVDGDTFTLSWDGATTNSATLTSDADYIYFPASSVDDEFNYTVTDAFSATDSAKVHISIMPTTGQQPGQITSVSGTPPGPYSASMTFYGILNTSYHVQRATTLADDGDWDSPGAPVTADENGVIEYTDEDAPVDGAYYRLTYP